MPAKAGLYLHIPYCLRVCPYCDFAVTTGSPQKRSRYVRVVEREVVLWQGDEHFSFDTVYLGGGTPSTIEAEDLGRLLETVRGRLAVERGSPVCLEVNPEDVNRDLLGDWRDLGVTTISLGVQSFSRAELKLLGRRHDAEQVQRCVIWCREAGFETVSMDLIYGLPGQDLSDWRRSLEQLTRLAPDHVSCYQLTFHEETPFGRGLEKGVLKMHPERLQSAFFDLTHRFLGDAGYEGYEVSNFSRGRRHRSLHNQKYWSHVPYLGLGVSAHSFRGNERWWNDRSVAGYERMVCAGEKPVAGRESLSPSQLALEAVLLRLRTREGLRLEEFRERYGFDLLARNCRRIEHYIGAGLLELESGRLFPTLRGMAVADSLARELEVE